MHVIHYIHICRGFSEMWCDEKYLHTLEQKYGAPMNCVSADKIGILLFPTDLWPFRLLHEIQVCFLFVL